MGKATQKAQEKAVKATQLAERKRVVLEVLRGCDEVAAATLAKIGVAPTCAAGCAHCCSLEVPVTRAEADVLVEWLHAHRADALDAIRAKLRGWLAWYRGELAERVRGGMERADAFFRHGVPCALLTDDGRCGAYEVRPVTCRNHLVKSPAAQCDPAVSTAEPEGILEVPRATYDHVVRIRHTIENQGGNWMASVHLLPEWLIHLLDVEREPWLKA